MDILNALVKHYDAMAAAGNATPFGWTHKFAQYAVELNDDGEIDRIFALGDLSDKKNKGEEFEMPTRRPRSGKLPIPYVFCDDAEHLLGKVGEASNLVRYTMMRDAVFMLRDLLGHSKALDVVYKFYETWDPEKALDNKCVSDVMEAKGQEKKTFILFYNGVPVFDDETFRKSYAAIVNKYGEMPIDTLKGGEIALLPEPIKIRSMISGNIGFKARLFRAITAWGNKKNGPVTNTLLSNNKANTEYFGRQQGNAIPITMQDEHKIYEAATDLLGSKHRFPVPATSQSLYSKNQIIWSDDMPTKLEDAVIDLCCCRSDKAKTISQANESGSETTIRMNPPYERRYGCATIVANVLDSVPAGTKCAFILPDKKMEKESKLKALLERHTLTTIIKLPENLFFGLGVTTSIFIFETGKPQNGRNIKGYYVADDGLETVKNKGRQDVHDKWPALEDYWVKAIQDDNDDRYNTRQLINPAEHLSYQMPEKPFELYEEDFIKTVMDYEMYKRGINAKEFGDKLLQKVLYGSTVTGTEEGTNILVGKGESNNGED